jgi:hypothetical protein
VVDQFRHEFVESVPEQLDQRVLYVSMRYATVIHLCACGCGTETVTRLDPSDYKLTYDGESISLSPSIGNWQFPCRSHYFIRRSSVEWAGDMTEKQIAAGRARNRLVKAAADDRSGGTLASKAAAPDEIPSNWRSGIRARLRSWTGRLLRR